MAKKQKAVPVPPPTRLGAKRSTQKQRRQKLHAAEMYGVLDDLRRTVFVNGGHPDEIMRVAADALRLVRIVDGVTN